MTNRAKAWLAIKRVIIHAMRSIDETAAQKTCRIGLSAPVTLKQSVEIYFRDCDELIGQLLGSRSLGITRTIPNCV